MFVQSQLNFQLQILITIEHTIKVGKLTLFKQVVPHNFVVGIESQLSFPISELIDSLVYLGQVILRVIFKSMPLVEQIKHYYGVVTI